MIAFIASLVFVVLAEMGDKTQLLAMAFATRFTASKVLLAVFLATIINHTMAVIAGHYLASLVPIEIISFVAAFSFIIYGLWMLHGDQLQGEGKKVSRFGPILTVSIAFFLAEMGDKTQLATISLAIKYPNMISVLMGTTLGMVVADTVGIMAAVVMKKHLPVKIIKWFSAITFVLFGLSSMFKILSGHLK